MALTLSQIPPILLLSDQPAVFKITTDYTDPCRIIGRVTGETGDSLVPDTKHEVWFELSDYLKGRISVRGKTGNSPATYSSDVPKQRTFTFEEYYDDEVQTTEISETFYVLDGKIPGRLRKAFYATYTSLFNYLVSTKSCLSWWAPLEPKKVLPGQKEFLNYLQVKSPDPVNLNLSVALMLNDGTVHAGPVQSAINNVSFMSLVYFPVGYTQLGIPAFMETNYPGKTVELYTVAVFSGQTTYSTVYSFKPLSKYYHRTRELWIKNPFGLYEVVLCTGIGTHITENKPESAFTDGINQPDKLTWQNIRTDKVKVNTGLLTASQAQWLTDLLDTTEACELIDGVLHPIVLKDSTIEPVHDGNFLFSGEIEYEYAYQEPVEIDS